MTFTNKEQVFLQEIDLNLDNQSPKGFYERIDFVIDFLYGGVFDEIFLEEMHKTKEL